MEEEGGRCRFPRPEPPWPDLRSGVVVFSSHHHRAARATAVAAPEKRARIGTNGLRTVQHTHEIEWKDYLI
jgi:hypothetical protein